MPRFLRDGAVCGGVGSPFGFLGGITMLGPSAALAVAEWAAFYRKQSALGTGILAGSCLASLHLPSLESSRMSVRPCFRPNLIVMPHILKFMVWFIAIGTAIALYFGFCGFFRLRHMSRSDVSDTQTDSLPPQHTRRWFTHRARWALLLIVLARPRCDLGVRRPRWQRTAEHPLDVIELALSSAEIERQLPGSHPAGCYGTLYGFGVRARRMRRCLASRGGVAVSLSSSGKSSVGRVRRSGIVRLIGDDHGAIERYAGPDPTKWADKTTLC